MPEMLVYTAKALAVSAAISSTLAIMLLQDEDGWDVDSTQLYAVEGDTVIHVSTSCDTKAEGISVNKSVGGGSGVLSEDSLVIAKGVAAKISGRSSFLSSGNRWGLFGISSPGVGTVVEGVYEGPNQPAARLAVARVDLPGSDYNAMSYPTLMSPIILDRDGQMLLLVQGRYIDGAQTQRLLVCIASLEPVLQDGKIPEAFQEGLGGTIAQGTLIAEGIDPRCVRSDSGYLLAVRDPEECHASRRLPGRVTFYRSDDLLSWSLDEKISGSLAALGNYEIAEAGGSLFLATAAEIEVDAYKYGSAEDKRQLDVFRFSDGAWVLIEGSKPGPLRHPDEPFWLIPHQGAFATGVDLMYMRPEGKVQVHPVP